MPATLPYPSALVADWQRRLDHIVAMMREMSLQTDPQQMVRDYARQVRQLMPVDRHVSLSRRDLEPPWYRITRSSLWSDPVNPWKQKDRLPLFDRGLLGELIYGDEPRIISDLQVDPDDPAHEYLAGMRSLIALPLYDGGIAQNMVVQMLVEPDGFDPESLPERIWMGNLFGRATGTLVLKEELRAAYETVDRELKIVADIQRSLLPQTIPTIPGLNLAAHYHTSRWAGGDYYDFFELPQNKWGLLIADVSGHGTPAAVMMAIIHALAHGHPGYPEPPARLLHHVNDRLTTHYTLERNETFVTAFYGIFDPNDRTLTYASAGHNPPRWKHCGEDIVYSLDSVGGLPLGLFPDQKLDEATIRLRPAIRSSSIPTASPRPSTRAARCSAWNDSMTRSAPASTTPSS